MASLSDHKLYLFPGRRSELNASDHEQQGPFYEQLATHSLQDSPRRQQQAVQKSASPTRPHSKQPPHSSASAPILSPEELIKQAANAVKLERQQLVDSARRREEFLQKHETEMRAHLRSCGAEQMQLTNKAVQSRLSEERREDVEKDQTALFLAHRHAEEQRSIEQARLARIEASKKGQRLPAEAAQPLAFEEDETRSDIGLEERLGRETIMHVHVAVPSSSGFEMEEADKMAKEEADKKAQEEADRLAKEEADKKAQEEAEKKAQEEADRRAKEEADKKAKEEAEKKAKEEAEKKAKEEAEKRAQEEADKKAKEEAEKRAQEEAEKKAKEEAEKFLKDDSSAKAMERSLLSVQLRSSVRDGSPRNGMEASTTDKTLDMWFEGDDDDDRGPVQEFYRREIEKEEARERRDFTMAWAKLIMKARNQKRMSTVAAAVAMAASMSNSTKMKLSAEKDAELPPEKPSAEPYQEL